MNKIFICQLCNRHFNRKYNLNQHMKRKNPCVKKEENKNDINTLAHFGSSRLNSAQFGSIRLNLAQFGSSSKKLKKGFNCDFCQYFTDKKGNLNRHLKTCKVKKEKEEEKELKLELAKKQIEILKLQAQVASGNTNCNNTNTNNTVNNTVNVTVNDYGKENINFLESNKYKKLITQILGNGMLGLQQYIKYKYCNPQQPENLTIKYTNDRSNNLKVRTNNEWKTRNKSEVIDELYDRDNNIEEVLNIYECINDLKDDVHMDKIQVHFVDEIDKYYDDDDDDKEIEKEMRRIKNKTLNHFYDCYKQNKNKFE